MSAPPNPDGDPLKVAHGRPARLGLIAREWLRIGFTGFGGPPAHIALLRELVVDRQHWMDPAEFQDANAAFGLLPGPASTQLAIFCAYRVGGPAGAIVGGLAFIVPAVVLVLLLSVLFLAHRPPLWVRGAGAGAGAAVGAVAVHAGRGFLGPSFARVRDDRARVTRWCLYLAVGTVGAVTLGSYLVLALLGCGVVEYVIARRPNGLPSLGLLLVPATVSSAVWAQPHGPHSRSERSHSAEGS